MIMALRIISIALTIALIGIESALGRWPIAIGLAFIAGIKTANVVERWNNERHRPQLH